MKDGPSLRCPRCGGTDALDLTRIRRGTGIALVAGSLAAVAGVASLDLVTPPWALGVCAGVLLLGLATLLGARRARYCPRCKVRLGPPPSD